MAPPDTTNLMRMYTNSIAIPNSLKTVKAFKVSMRPVGRVVLSKMPYPAAAWCCTSREIALIKLIAHEPNSLFKAAQPADPTGCDKGEP